jgi:hypothetical protein
MRGNKWFILLASLALVLLASNIGVTRGFLVDLESSTGNTFQAWVSRQWTQTTQGDFNAGVLNNVDTASSAGNVKLEITSLEPTTSVGAEESWYFTSWSRRAPVTVNNAGSGLTDYQVRVDVTYDADMNPDFSDIRFVDSDGSTELSHWRESYVDSTSAIFWVKVPSIPSGSKVIYMYYGNAAASSASDGDATFEFFDDFEEHAAGEIPDGWTMYSGCSGVVVQDDAGNKVLDDGTGSGGNVIAGDPSWTDIACRQRFRSVDDVVYHAGLVVRYTDEGNEIYGGIVTDTTAEIWNRIGGTWTQIGGTWTIPDVGTSWHVQELRIAGDAVELYIDDAYIGSGTLTSGAPTSGASGFWCQYSQQGYRDEHIVRKYADPEPTASIGTEDGWSRRAPVTVNNPGSALTDYQVRVDVTYDADMQPDFDDIRFRDSDGSTELSHWRESYIASTSAIFWVKVPSVPAGAKTIYMYYGNDAASSASDGDATFIFFDDFSGDLSKWNIHIDTDVAITASYGNPAPCLEISGGVTSSPYGFAAIGSDATYTGFQDGIIEADIYPATVALPEIIFRGDYSANTGYKGRWDCRSGSETPWMRPPYSGWGGFGTAVLRFGIANQWQKAKLVIWGSTFEIYSNDNPKSIVTNTQYPGPGEIGLANHYGTYARFDNVRVRKCPQRAYLSPGTIASQVRDTGVAGARWDGLFWDEILPGGTSITFEVRASDTLFAKDTPDATLPWISVGGISPVTSGLPSGRYMQWQATLNTSDPSETPVLQEVRVYHY